MWVEITLIISLFLICGSLMVQNTRRLNTVLDENLKLKDDLAEAKTKIEALSMENEHLIAAIKSGDEPDRDTESAGGMGSKPVPPLKDKNRGKWKR